VSDLDSFLDRFFAFGDKPSVETYMPLFDPRATLFDAGMERPITVPEIPDHIAGILALVPGFRMTPERWRERNGTVFVEARNQASLGGSEARWRSVYCVDLEGDRVIRGRRYYDRRSLYARLGPGVPSLPEYTPEADEAPDPADPLTGPEEIMLRFGEAWTSDSGAALQRLFREDGTLSSPDVGRPIARDELAHYRADLRQRLPELRLELLCWAGDDVLAFGEWRMSGRTHGRTIQVGVVDRLDLAAGLVLSARAYFDTLDLLNALAPPSEAAAEARPPRPASEEK
jgi:hypothetical protein